MSTPQASPAEKKPHVVPPAAAEALAICKKVEEFYGKYAGQTGFNPYFYLHKSDFFNLQAKAKEAALEDTKVIITPEDLAKLKAITFEEKNARPDKAPDLYRTVTASIS